MSSTVLGSVSLGYHLIWNSLRQLSGVQLFIGAQNAAHIDAPHLLSALDEVWSEQAPTLILSVQTPQLLGDLLNHATQHSPWIEVHAAQLRDPTLAERVRAAHQRGLRMVWRGEPGTRPSPGLAACFLRPIVTLTPEEALSGLRVSLRKHHGADTPFPQQLKSPVVAGHIYESVASRVLTEHCLDQQGAWGVVGWPMDDVLHGYRHNRIQPGHRTIVRLMEAVDADESNERIALILSEAPILAYRLLRYLNSAGLGLGTEIESLRHGLMVLGLSRLRAWLLEQLPQASGDLNLQPVRTALVVRAHLMEHLLDAGESEDLRQEVYWCGLLSQMDLLLGEGLPTVLGRIPLSERIRDALLNHEGPYWPYLEIATALESPTTQITQALCENHQMSLESVNRALLATLSHARLRPSKGRLLN
jgi:c-di-GMP phosphodiesterase